MCVNGQKGDLCYFLELGTSRNRKRINSGIVVNMPCQMSSSQEKKTDIFFSQLKFFKFSKLKFCNFTFIVYIV